ncbi:hypothetical protein ACHAPT_013590 [Fusarium lateritium]
MPWSHTIPKHLLSVKHHPDQLGPDVQICIAYEALFELDKKHHASPPDLYKLANVKPIPNDAKPHAKVAHVGGFMAALHKKTQKHYDDMRSLSQGSAKNREMQLIQVWVKIGLVLVKEEIRDMYDREIKGKISKGLHKVCGQRWEKMKLGREP